MRLVSYRSEGRWRAGVEDGSRLVDVASLGRVASSSQDGPVTVRALLEAEPAELAAVLEAAAHALASGETSLALETVELGPPVPDPDKIICLGLNYAEHAGEAGMDLPQAPILFAKFRNALVGPQSAIVLPSASDEVDYEGELAVVVGRRCKDVSEQSALEYVAGYAVFNDVSARDLQFQSSQWTAGKALDTFAPMGPGLVPASEIPDPQALVLTTRVNGRVLQQASTSDMLFPVAATIAFISRLMTLVPGDVIATGTPAGVGFKREPPVFLTPGDTVEVEIERVGLIRNPVVAPGAPELATSRVARPDSLVGRR